MRGIRSPIYPSFCSKAAFAERMPRMISQDSTTRTTRPTKDIEHGDAGYEVDPSPFHECETVLSVVEAVEEVREEHEADDGIERFQERCDLADNFSVALRRSAPRT